MFRTLQNTVSIDVTLVPDGPILVRAQSVGIDPGPADMEFQRTHRNGKPTVFLAGSGLKGVLRSHSERLLRSVGRFACDPTQTKDRSNCGTKKERGLPSDYPHADQCDACFTFGSLKLAGRFRIGDAYPAPGMEEAANRTEVRAGVGIERRSQAAATREGVLYDAEVVVGGGFRARISGESFSLWQLGLVLAALQDVDAGLVRIGGAKARGMGSVRLQDWSVEFGFLSPEMGKILGAKPMKDDKTNKYGLPPNDHLPAPDGAKSFRRGLFHNLRYEGTEAVQTLATSLIEGPLQRYLEERS
jgi:CRISPR/Cas system CSM-associated protein Csm3 (group 7 of RAMP superfamily)